MIPAPPLWILDPLLTRYVGGEPGHQHIVISYSKMHQNTSFAIGEGRAEIISPFLQKLQNYPCFLPSSVRQGKS